MNCNRDTLIIGGGGFIGTYLVRTLCKTGRRITVLDRNCMTTSDRLSGVEYVTGDFTCSSLIGKLLDHHHEIIYLAYATIPNTSFENPLVDLLENLPPTVQLFSEVARRGAKLLLVSSGGTVYGEALELPINELHRTRPISPYGVTKLTLENYAHLYAKTHDLKYICVRPANAYGGGQRPYIGQGFISTAMSSIMRNGPIKIFGQTGTIRDYIYVSDLAEGIVAAMDKGRLSETYNIGSGVGHSNLDVIEVISAIIKPLGYHVRIEHLPERSFDVRQNVLNTEKLHLETGWSMETDFEKGLKMTWTWLGEAGL